MAPASLLHWILALLLLTYGVNMLITVLLSVLFLSRCLCLAKAAFHVRVACAQNRLGVQQSLFCSVKSSVPTRPGPAARPACHSSGSPSCLGHFNQGPAHNDPRGHSFTEEGNRREGGREGAALGAVVELMRRTAGPAEQ